MLLTRGPFRRLGFVRSHRIAARSLLSCRRTLFASTMTPMEPPPDQPEKKLINLLRGWPSPHVLPAELLKAAANKVLSDPAIFVPGLQYGPDPGYQPLREELARFLARAYGTEADAERICITGGASQSLACILQSYTEPVYTKAVWAIAPCYYLACPIFEDSGFKGRLRAVPEDSEGIDLEWLERGLKAFEEGIDPDEQPVYKNPNLRKVYRHVIYGVPTSANPSGKTMSLKRRTELVHLARKYDCLVICDDVYDFLQWPVLKDVPTPGDGRALPALPPTKPLPRLSDIDFSLGPSSHDGGSGGGSGARGDDRGWWFGHAISNGSFSKIVGPGIRTGWVEGTRDFAFGLAQTGSTKSGGAPSQLSATMVCELVRSGALARHIDGACRPGLQRRHALLMAAVHEHLDQFGIEVTDANVAEQEEEEEEGAGGVYGGYFVWITFPQGPAAEDIAKRAMDDENLIVPPGEMFEVKGDEDSVRFSNSIRLCFSWEEEEDLVEGVARLGRAVASLRDEKVKTSQEGGPGSKKLDTFF